MRDGMAFKRKTRLSELILQEVSMLVQKLKAPFLNGILTLHSIELSNDLKVAVIYYSVLGESDDIEYTQTAMEQAQYSIRRKLGSRLRLKYIPQIIFKYDRTPERAGRINELLIQIEKETEK